MLGLHSVLEVTRKCSLEYDYYIPGAGSIDVDWVDVAGGGFVVDGVDIFSNELCLNYLTRHETSGNIKLGRLVIVLK